jgi:hypothetical protein
MWLCFRTASVSTPPKPWTKQIRCQKSPHCPVELGQPSLGPLPKPLPARTTANATTGKKLWLPHDKQQLLKSRKQLHPTTRAFTAGVTVGSACNHPPTHPATTDPKKHQSTPLPLL